MSGGYALWISNKVPHDLLRETLNPLWDVAGEVDRDTKVERLIRWDRFPFYVSQTGVEMKACTYWHCSGTELQKSEWHKLLTAPGLVLSMLQPGMILDSMTIQLLILSLLRLSTVEWNIFYETCKDEPVLHFRTVSYSSLSVMYSEAWCLSYLVQFLHFLATLCCNHVASCSSRNIVLWLYPYFQVKCS